MAHLFPLTIIGCLLSSWHVTLSTFVTRRLCGERTVFHCVQYTVRKIVLTFPFFRFARFMLPLSRMWIHKTLQRQLHSARHQGVGEKLQTGHHHGQNAGSQGRCQQNVSTYEYTVPTRDSLITTDVFENYSTNSFLVWFLAVEFIEVTVAILSNSLGFTVC